MSENRSPRWIATAWLLPLVAITLQLDAQEVAGVVYPPDVFRAISAIEEAGPPIVLQDEVVFTFRSDRYVRYVAVAFAHEEFRQLHLFSARPDIDTPPNDELLFLVYPIQPEMRELRYRLVVDGVWMSDPNGIDQIRDSRGISLSRVTLMERPISEYRSPVVRSDGTVEFRFAFDIRVANEVETLDERSISIGDVPRYAPMVVGSFNGWDPFVDRMSADPESPNLYSLITRLPPGEYYYYYLIGGERFLDPTNPLNGFDTQTGAFVSRLVVPNVAE